MTRFLPSPPPPPEDNTRARLDAHALYNARVRLTRLMREHVSPACWHAVQRVVETLGGEDVSIVLHPVRSTGVNPNPAASVEFHWTGTDRRVRVSETGEVSDSGARGPVEEVTSTAATSAEADGPSSATPAVAALRKSAAPTRKPAAAPSRKPAVAPSLKSLAPTRKPAAAPSRKSAAPTRKPTVAPSRKPAAPAVRTDTGA